MTESPQIAVAVWTSSTLADEGVEVWIDQQEGFVHLPFRERADSDVLLLLAPQAVDRALAAIRVPADGRVRPAVLVTDRLEPRQAALAGDHGLVRFLDHATTSLSEIADALVAAVEECRSPAPGTRSRLWSGSISPAEDTEVEGTGLTAREIEVLRLLAAGHRIAEIGAQLSYSERTIKGIVHGVVTRFGFRNRVQAVAYAIRVGAF